MKAYQSGENRFIKFCINNDLCPGDRVSEAVLCKFVAHLADEGLKHRTIKTYLSGVRYFQIRKGRPDPFRGSSMPRLDYVMRGVKRHQAKLGVAQRPRLPITPSLLRRLKGVWLASGGERDTKLIWAACCLCFFGFLRAGELTVPDGRSFDPKSHLGVGDVAVDDKRSPSLIRIRIKQSKTDPFRKG